MTPNPPKPPAAPDPNAPPPDAAKESKGDRFKRVAGMRTTAVLKALDNLDNTANKGTYEWTPEQADKIVGALRARVDRLDARYKGEAVKDGGFAL